MHACRFEHGGFRFGFVWTSVNRANFDKLPNQIQEFKKMNDRFRGIFIPKFNNAKLKDVTCNWFILETRGSD